MSKQMELPHNGTPTSRAAAEAKRDAEKQRAQVLAFIKSRGQYGATDLEIQDGTGIDGDSERPRRWELASDKDGAPEIVPLMNGLRKVKRMTPSHRKAQVWVAIGIGDYVHGVTDARAKS